MRVVYDTSLAAGSRVLSITLDDGTVLVANGQVVAGARTVSLATIDFTANGGDGYQFAALGGVIRASRYGAATPFDLAAASMHIARATK